MSFNKILRKIKKQKVNFLIAGVQKGGTTILDHYLRQHPDTCMASKKEVHFFDNEKLFSNNLKPNYDLYHSHFDEFNDKSIRGEATPIYSYWKPAPERIFQYNNNMKIILLLRNPIDRAYSHWNKERFNFHSLASTQQEAVETLSFHDAINAEKQRCLAAFPLQHRYYSYIDRGLYTLQIERLLQFFPRDNLLILKSESLKYDTQETYNKVCDFLSIKNMPLPHITQSSQTELQHNTQTSNRESPVDSPLRNPHNPTDYDKPISVDDKKFLQNIFREEITNLENILKWDCSEWLD